MKAIVASFFLAAGVFSTALVTGLIGHANAESCVSDSLLGWVDNREANAISPTRWQSVRETLLGNDGGMSLGDMEVIYNRRVSNGWSAGHWVPIISAVKCLQAPPPEVAELPDMGETNTSPITTTADISQPPADFFYFDDHDEMTSWGDVWTKQGRRLHHVWQRPDGEETQQPMYAWNEWGPWDDLPEATRVAIHEVPDG